MFNTQPLVCKLQKYIVQLEDFLCLYRSGDQGICSVGRTGEKLESYFYLAYCPTNQIMGLNLLPFSLCLQKKDIIIKSLHTSLS